MLKIVVLIDCDICQLPFHKMAFDTGSDLTSYEPAVRALENCAEADGWNCFRGAHHCFECFLEAMHPEKFRQT